MAARRQRSAGRGETCGIVEPIIGRTKQAIGAVIDIEQDRVERLAAIDGGGDIANVNVDAGIVEAVAVQG
ncbi:hypothetical protein D3C87_1741080 [compost metagenome]